jgi:hypothetical protein
LTCEEVKVVDENILLIQNEKNQNKPQACHFKNDYNKDSDIEHYFNNNKTILKELSKDSWFI